MNVKRFIGDKGFYKRIMTIAVPIMVQNGITNFVSLLDNIMVGGIGTEQMSGVAIINQLVFIYYLMMFGGLSGVGIFTAQYFGKRDMEGIRHTFRYKLWMAFLLSALAAVLFLTFEDTLINMYLHKSEDGGDLHATYLYGKTYVRIIFFALPPVMLQMVYASSLRECSETVLPMKAGITAVLVNL
ncbi:MAG: MATE family efflux transporter, partial [Lachnospiraceae bacterium]|nr:MATE family efflux transporter [Lachnospiraceae bacterium]